MESVKYFRKLKGLTQMELAKEAEVGQDTITQIETGRRNPHPSTLRKLARALGVEVADFYLEPASPKAHAPHASVEDRVRALPLESIRRLLESGYGRAWSSGGMLEARAVADRLAVTREELLDLLVQAEPREARRLLVSEDEDEDEGTLVYMEVLREGNIDDAEKWRRLSAFREVA